MPPSRIAPAVFTVCSSACVYTQPPGCTQHQHSCWQFGDGRFVRRCMAACCAAPGSDPRPACSSIQPTYAATDCRCRGAGRRLVYRTEQQVRLHPVASVRRRANGCTGAREATEITDSVLAFTETCSTKDEETCQFGLPLVGCSASTYAVPFRKASPLCLLQEIQGNGWTGDVPVTFDSGKHNSLAAALPTVPPVLHS
jgi:hypothetical protein